MWPRVVNEWLRPVSIALRIPGDTLASTLATKMVVVMAGVLRLLLLVPGALLMGGCVPMMALSAVDMAVRSSRPTPKSNGHLQPKATESCKTQAAQYGAVHIIDVQQARIDKIIVWGTVDDGKQRRSFECSFGTAITGFKLRPINASK